MEILKLILIVFSILIGLPSLAYLIVKFGAAGYFRAKRRDSQRTKPNKHTEQI